MEIKKYEVIFVDEWDNWHFLGFFDKLEEADPIASDCIKDYNGEDGKPIQFDGLFEYPSTFGYCFDRIFETECGSIQIRGFIFY